MSSSETRAAALVVSTIYETIQETGKEGCPLGPMYAALMGMISYNSFTNVITALAQAGVIRISNNCAYAIKVKS
jgi:hypothetical protein